MLIDSPMLVCLCIVGEDSEYLKVTMVRETNKWSSAYGCTHRQGMSCRNVVSTDLRQEKVRPLQHSTALAMQGHCCIEQEHGSVAEAEVDVVGA